MKQARPLILRAALPCLFLPFVALSGCSLAANSMGWPGVLDADSKSRQIIAALATSDKAKLLALNIPETLSDKVIADARGRIASKEGSFVLEDMNGELYCRQYTVARTRSATDSPPTIDVRLWFAKATNEFSKDHAILKSVDFIEPAK